MSTPKSRREPRIEVALNITLQTLRGEEHHQTHNVSFAGVFVICPNPLPLGKLVRFKTHLPGSGEELQMMGLVAHTINTADAAELGRYPGMGIQIFSIGEETGKRWRSFIREEYEKHPEAELLKKHERPHVRVRIPTAEKLERFFNHHLLAGHIFLHTADLHPVGTPVYCDVVHPITEEIFVLDGIVDEVIPTPIRQRGLRLALTAPNDMTSIRTFIEAKEVS